MISPESTMHFSIFERIEKRRSFFIGQWNERSPDECDETKNSTNGKTDVPFRERASTDGTIFSRPRRWPPRVVQSHPPTNDRRMSISLRGSNGSY